jgi:hypothetical protein
MWKNVKARTVVLVAAVAGIAAFLTNVREIADLFKHWFNPDKVELVDVSYLGNDSLDIKLRNNASGVSLLKRIEFTIRNNWVLVPDDEARAFLPSDSSYDLRFDSTTAAGSVLKKDISEELSANRAGRFIVHFGSNPMKMHGSRIYLADMDIVYDENDRHLRKENVFFFMPDRNAIYYAGDGPNTGNRALNDSIIGTIDGLKGIKSAALNDLIASSRNRK